MGRRSQVWLTSNWFFLILFAGGAALRIAVMVAYQPALPLVKDAFMYVERSLTWSPAGSFHPFLYPVLLRPLLVVDDLAWVAAAQHLSTLAMALMLYLLLRHLGVTQAVAASGGVPLLFDAYQLNIEHHVLSETFSQLFIVAGLVVLAWYRRPHWTTVGAAGVLLAMSALVRFPGLAMIVAAAIYILLRQMGWVRFVALIVGFLTPLALYSAWFQSHSGSIGLTNRNGFFLYGRVLSFADCREVPVSGDLKVFCPEGRQPKKKGLFTSGLPDDVRRDPSYNAKAMQFSLRMIFAKPGSYFAAIASDFLMYFETSRPETREPGAEKWVFPTSIEERKRRAPAGSDISVDYRADATLAGLLHHYQRTAWTFGPLVAALLLLGTIGGLVGWRRPRARSLAPECWLFTLGAFGLMLFPAVFGVYHVRYVLPALPLLGPAGALGVQAIVARLGVRRVAS